MNMKQEWAVVEVTLPETIVVPVDSDHGNYWTTEYVTVNLVTGELSGGWFTERDRFYNRGQDSALFQHPEVKPGVYATVKNIIGYGGEPSYWFAYQKNGMWHLSTKATPFEKGSHPVQYRL